MTILKHAITTIRHLLSESMDQRLRKAARAYNTDETRENLIRLINLLIQSGHLPRGRLTSMSELNRVMKELGIIKEDLQEADEPLRRLIRGGLLDRLESKVGDPEEWEKVVHQLGRYGAYLTFTTDDQLWSPDSDPYFVQRVWYVDMKKHGVDPSRSHWRMEYSSVGNKRLQGLLWPFDYVVRRAGGGHGTMRRSGMGPLRTFHFDYVMKSDV